MENIGLLGGLLANDSLPSQFHSHLLRNKSSFQFIMWLPQSHVLCSAPLTPPAQVPTSFPLTTRLWATRSQSTHIHIHPATSYHVISGKSLKHLALMSSSVKWGLKPFITDVMHLKHLEQYMARSKNAVCYGGNHEVRQDPCPQRLWLSRESQTLNT